MLSGALAEYPWLAPYATRNSLGRKYPEADHPYRPPFVRDRDRIVHSSAFRRLLGKTQVFVRQPNDHVRNRLTHTLEVTQIARSLARNLGLNEDLTEAIALSHDLGHPPFGHAGERALQAMLADAGGFEHNRQGLRIVEQLEARYPRFPGLNLTHEVREAMAYHSKSPESAEVAPYLSQGQMSLECQVVDLADSIAYDAHDTDDALRADLLRLSDLKSLPLWQQAQERVWANFGRDLAGKTLARATLREILDCQVGAVIQESRRWLQNIASPEQARRSERPLIALPTEVATIKAEFEAFLFERVYRHPQVVSATRQAEELIRALFAKLLDTPKTLPDRFQRRLEKDTLARVVGDYLAGMTDRYASAVAKRLGIE